MGLHTVAPRVGWVFGLGLSPPVGLSRARCPATALAPVLRAHPFALLTFLLWDGNGSEMGSGEFSLGDGTKVSASGRGDPGGENPPSLSPAGIEATRIKGNGKYGNEQVHKSDIIFLHCLSQCWGADPGSQGPIQRPNKIPSP